MYTKDHTVRGSRSQPGHFRLRVCASGVYFETFLVDRTNRLHCLQQWFLDGHGLWWQMRAIRGFCCFWRVLVFHNSCPKFSSRVKEMCFGRPRIRAWIFTLAHRYFNSHTLLMIKCRKCFSNHDGYVGHYWSPTLYIDDKCFRERMGCHARRYSYWRWVELINRWQFACLHCVLFKPCPAFLYCKMSFVGNGEEMWSKQR